MKHILIICPDTLVNSMGGLGVQIFNTIKNFDPNFFFWIYCFGSLDDPNDCCNGVNYKTIHTNILPLKAFVGNNMTVEQLFLYFTDLMYIIMCNLPEKIDLIHLFDWPSVYVGRIIANRLKVPYLLTLSLSLEKNMEAISKHYGINNLDNICDNLRHAINIEKTGIIECARLITCSYTYADMFSNIFNDKKRIVFNGIDLEDWNKHVDKYIFPGKRKYKVLYIGRFALSKGLLEIFQANIPENMDIIFVGSSKGGDEYVYRSMLEYCKKHDYAHYLGPKYNDEKIAVIKHADCVLMPSIHEPFGIVGLETLASQTILLSSFVDGLGDFLTEEYSINCGTSSNTITDALNKFIILTDDEKNNMKKLGYEACKEYTWDDATNCIKNIYNEFFDQ